MHILMVLRDSPEISTGVGIAFMVAGAVFSVVATVKTMRKVADAKAEKLTEIAANAEEYEQLSDEDICYLYAFKLMRREDVADAAAQADNDLRRIIRYIRDSESLNHDAYLLQDDIVCAINNRKLWCNLYSFCCTFCSI